MTQRKQTKKTEDVEYKLYEAYREDFFAFIIKKSQAKTEKAIKKALNKAFDAGFSDRKIETIRNEAIADTKKSIASWDKEIEEKEE